MPFAITCPACRHKFRSAKQRELGKAVQCAKCQEQFAISAENQSEVKKPPTQRSSSRKEDNNEFEERAKPKKKSSSLWVVVALLAFVMLGAAGAGVYFTFFRGSATAEHRVQPQRDLPMDAFIYRPSDQAKIEFSNLALCRERGWKNMLLLLPGLDTELPPQRKIDPDAIESVCVMGRRAGGNTPVVVVISYLNPVDIAVVAADCQMKPIPGNDHGVFSVTTPAGSWVAFQGGPNRIVFLSASSKSKIDLETMAKFAERTVENSPLPEELREGIAHVSGYPSITAAVYAGSGVKAIYTGSFFDQSDVLESYSMTVCDTHQVALDQVKSSQKHQSKFGAEDKKAVGNIETIQWVKGDRSFSFNRRDTRKNK